MNSRRELINYYASIVSASVAEVPLFRYKHMRGAIGGFLTAISVSILMSDRYKDSVHYAAVIMSMMKDSASRAQKMLLLDMQRRKASQTSGDKRLKGAVYSDLPEDVVDFFVGDYCSLEPYKGEGVAFAKARVSSDFPLYEEGGYEVSPDKELMFGVYDNEERAVHIFASPLTFTVKADSEMVEELDLFSAVIAEDKIEGIERHAGYSFAPIVSA